MYNTLVTVMLIIHHIPIVSTNYRGKLINNIIIDLLMNWIGNPSRESARSNLCNDAIIFSLFPSLYGQVLDGTEICITLPFWTGYLDNPP